MMGNQHADRMQAEHDARIADGKFLEQMPDRIIAAKDEEIAKLREALQEAVNQYGKPGGPWNVPSDPGGWIARARAALEGK